MDAKDPLVQFVREALLAGKSRAEIQSVLQASGWSSKEADSALAAYSDVPFIPPVPRPRLRLTARDAFVYLLLFTALGISAWQLIWLIFSILNLVLPDPVDYAYVERQSADQIRWGIASLVVSVPAFVAMTLYTDRKIAQDAGHQRSLVRNWLTYLALFVSALSFLGVAVYVIYSFLKGEITLRFILKAATVALVSAGIFVFYLRGLEDFRDEH
ncbi:DUF5671 domain-containing protein [Hyphomicrobium sp. CS1BSMeth3]|uniref:DUF5671 domain-containing protein n=1 Tax=Hyphomicrobium sp. CS1BSMeth3 TaxID=1892844 RepID=UPI0009314865|nr:DUF5671 domain-containing protein [Hyphomicrobium sp. CS1BSMeth3]